MNLKNIALWLGGLFAVAFVWLYWWIRPERQVRRAQGRLFTTVEKRNFEAMSLLIAEDYRDRWQQDKAIVLRGSREVFGQFMMLTIDRADSQAEVRGDSWVLREKVTLKGFGGPLAMHARDEVNKLREPFAMTWRRRSWKPWDWELIAVEHPMLELPR
ncbi:MAG: hypothetical protein ABL994_17230 [Verrucomicrobiales bacterium]